MNSTSVPPNFKKEKKKKHTGRLLALNMHALTRLQTWSTFGVMEETVGSVTTGCWWNLLPELIKVKKGRCPRGFPWNVSKSSLWPPLVVFPSVGFTLHIDMFWHSREAIKDLPLFITDPPSCSPPAILLNGSILFWDRSLELSRFLEIHTDTVKKILNIIITALF